MLLIHRKVALMIYFLSRFRISPVSSSQSVDTILSYYGDLIHKIKSKTDAKIIFTSLLPRLVDFNLSERKLNKVNSELRRLCKQKISIIL